MGDFDLQKDAPRPRLSHLIKRGDFVGYGFNLHAERNKVGQYVGKVDDGSPAALSGMKEHDRIVEVNGVNIGNENHKQVVERIKTNPNEAQLLVVDRATDSYYKERNIVIKGTLSSVLYLKTPTIEEEEKLNESMAKRVTIAEPAVIKDRSDDEEEYDPNYSTIATPSPPPPPEESSPPSPDDWIPDPPTPPRMAADVPSQEEASMARNQELEIQIPSEAVVANDAVTPPPPYESVRTSVNEVTPEASPQPSPNNNVAASSYEAASYEASAGIRGSPSLSRLNNATPLNNNNNTNNNSNQSNSNQSNSNQSNKDIDPLAADPAFGLSVADMRARLNAKKKVDVRSSGNFKEKYDIFQKL